jgi:hypothetical protein
MSAEMPDGWFARKSDEQPSFPWQACLRFDGVVYPLELWFSSEADCLDCIRDEIVKLPLL